MFEFRLINLPDGNQIICQDLTTPYNSLTPEQMEEYIEVDTQFAYMERMERKRKREETLKRKIIYKIMHKVACICGIM